MNTINEIEDFLGIKKTDMHDEIYCVLTGQFSSGKSRFMNKLIDNDYLPVGTREMTAVPTYIKSGKDMALVYKDSDCIKYSLTEIKNIKKGKCDCNKIELSISNFNTPSDLIFIDTPGINSVSFSKCDCELYKAEVIFYFLIKSISAFDVEMIDDICSKKNIKLIFIRTRIDDIKESEENINEVYADERELIKSIYPNADFFFVSLEDDESNHNQISELISYVKFNLKDEIENRRYVYTENYINNTIMPLLIKLKNELEIKQEDLNTRDSDRKIQKQIRNIKKNLNLSEELIRKQINSAKINYYKSGCIFIDKNLQEKGCVTCIEIQTYILKCMQKLEIWYELELSDIITCISGNEKIKSTQTILLSDDKLHEIFSRYEGKRKRFSDFSTVEQDYNEKMNEYIESSMAKAYLKKIFDSVFLKIDVEFSDSYSNLIDLIIAQLNDQYKYEYELINKYSLLESDNIEKITKYISELKKYGN